MSLNEPGLELMMLQTDQKQSVESFEAIIRKAELWQILSDGLVQSVWIFVNNWWGIFEMIGLRTQTQDGEYKLEEQNNG